MNSSDEVKDQPQTAFKGKYYYGTGRRKNAVARVRVYAQTQTKSQIIVNSKDYQEYFPTLEFRRIGEDCFRVTASKDKFSVSAKIRGGGKKGQAEALRHGIARAMVVMDEELYKTQLRDSGFLTRDPRKKERKKPGLKKARRAPQWQKR
ncbi:MAG: 30S ribosomal protein S9 [Candidatus Moraniibacteriota bacterium]